MPFLIIFGLFSLASAGVATTVNGSKSLLDARARQQTAEEKLARRRSAYQSGEKKAQDRVKEYLRAATTLRADVLGNWVRWLEINDKKVRLLKGADLHGTPIEVPDLPALQMEVADARSVLQGGVKALMTGFAARQATLHLVHILATSSTGTAIAGLSGAALESATLAWLGGGSLAAGGGGIAAGTFVLAGVAIAPGVFIAGLTLKMQGDKALTEVASYECQINLACEELVSAEQLLKRAVRELDERQGALSELAVRAERSLGQLRSVDFDPINHAKHFQETALLMRSLSELLRNPLFENSIISGRGDA